MSEHGCRYRGRVLLCRDDACIERENARLVAESERADKAEAEVERLRAAIREQCVGCADADRQLPGRDHYEDCPVAELRKERDSWRDRAVYAEGELSAALGLPPTIGPAPGEAARVVASLRNIREERDEARALLREALPALHDIGEHRWPKDDEDGKNFCSLSRCPVCDGKIAQPVNDCAALAVRIRAALGEEGER